jgi:hypothetical protein
LIFETSEAPWRLAETARSGIDAFCIVATDAAMDDSGWLYSLLCLLALAWLSIIEDRRRAYRRLRRTCPIFILVGSGVSV